MVLKVCLLVMLCQVLTLGQELNYAGWPIQATTPTTKGTTSGASCTTAGGGTGTTSSGGGTGTTSSGGGIGTTSSGGGTTPTLCLPSKYRNVEGLCGNPSAPSWGRANEPFARLLPSFYADGISAPAVMSNGAAYASARNISFFLFGIDELADTTRTMLNIYFLQAITNDLADTSSNTNNVCCTNGQVVSNAPDGCFPVVIEDDDPLYSWFNIKCLEYSRVSTAPQTNPPQTVRQINRATSYLDLSFLYGTSSVQNPSRITTGGRLLSVLRDGLEFPILDPAGCTSPLQDVCYLVADSRSYQSPMSAIVHLLFFREHNRLAVQLKNLNPSWSDLTLYEEARRINIAQYQRIVYYELLPKILGRTNMVNNRLIYESSGFVNDYDASQNPASIAEFANVVASFLNSQLPGAINFVVNGTIQSKELSSLYPKLQSLESDFATLFAAMSTQLARVVDTSFTIEWKNFMYRGNAPLGQDLLAIDLQKMRDFGFAPYNLYRARCGLSIFTSWEAYNATMKAPCEKTIQKIQAIYPTVNDMELFVGAAFETPLPGAVFGPTFSCIMTQQFLRARTGDRYFFETGAQEGSFTAAQLAEIRKISLARMMCSALPTILNVQADVLSPVGPTNPLVSCNSLPAVNLAAWISSSGGVTGTTPSGGGTGTTLSGGGTTPTLCLPSKYRNVEGLCGNPSAPSWGRANEPFARLLPSFYADGISTPAVMSNGAAYASVRNISFFLFGIDETTDTTRTMLNIYFLQAITNDLADTSSNTNNVCCTNGQVVSNAPDGCFPVVIEDDDPLYSWFNIKCLEYSRVSTAPQTNPPQTVRQINRATSYLDLSFLYGTSSVQNPSRITTGGRLLAVRRQGIEFPVLDPAGCTSPLQDVCYLVADSRSYQSPMSAIVHLLFFREHNRLALQLKLLNPSWSDLTLYEEARRINIAQYQRIVYYELLPKILGRTNMVNNRLIYESNGFVNDYNASQNPASIAEFANVVASFLNSQLPGAINFVVNGTIQSKELSSLYPKLQSLESDFATLFAAMSTQLARVVDTSFTIEWKNFMYRGNAPLGQDLLAIDLQKMRDFGFAPYNLYRARCGLSIFTSWEAYNATMKAPCEKTIKKIQAIYPTVDDMELFVGAAFETPLPGAVFGPTFSCIMTQQFLRARTGDRYFFETGAQEGSFTAAQLAEIRKISLARMMCSALPIILNVQADVLSPVGPTNPLVSLFGVLELRMLVKAMDILEHVLSSKLTVLTSSGPTAAAVAPLQEGPAFAQQLWDVLLEGREEFPDFFQILLAVKLNYSDLSFEDHQALVVKARMLVQYLHYTGLLEKNYPGIVARASDNEWDMFLASLLLRFAMLTTNRSSTFSYNLLFDEQCKQQVIKATEQSTSMGSSGNSVCKFAVSSLMPLVEKIELTSWDECDATEMKQMLEDAMSEIDHQLLDNPAISVEKKSAEQLPFAKFSRDRDSVAELWDEATLEAAQDCEEKDVILKALQLYTSQYVLRNLFTNPPNAPFTLPNQYLGMYRSTVELKDSSTPNTTAVLLTHGVVGIYASSDIEKGETLTMSYGKTGGNKQHLRTPAVSYNGVRYFLTGNASSLCRIVLYLVHAITSHIREVYKPNSIARLQELMRRCPDGVIGSVLSIFKQIEEICREAETIANIWMEYQQLAELVMMRGLLDRSKQDFIKRFAASL
ncbi:uncharacterized protein LOC126579333 [Anopheles aquasalis]|uniref:uncharacterized protein LOC126579333 n=1 Tax=Anopheles aquasalis TaxID=42839 RepID=UPI00215A3AF7|nr:uncharacterized protein LOC126579333 [Anopheles aquasalis]